MPDALTPLVVRSKDPPGHGYTCRGNRLLDEWAQNEPNGVTEASARVAEACGITRPLVATWRSGKRVPPKHWQTVSRATGIAVEEFETWEQLGPAEPEAPDFEERPAAPPRALGSTRDELAATVGQIDAALVSGGLTPAQKGQLLGKRATVLGAMARLEERQAIHEHPDAAGFLEDVQQALRDVLGEALQREHLLALGDRLAELQAARAAAPRRAAA